MYFEGKCMANQLIPSIVKHITDATDEAGNKLWEMISSNVGVRNSTNTDDGWVFKPKGAAGNKNVIGFSNGWFFNTSSAHWLWGNAMFMAAEYIPGVPGTNGKFKGYAEDVVPVFGVDWNNYVDSNMPMRYYLSVTKDRVICAYYSDVLHTYSRTNLIYLGKPLWTANPNDKGILMANGLGRNNRANSSIPMTDPFNIGTEEMESYTLRADLGDQARGWGGKLYPSRMVLHKASVGQGGQRAILDLLAVKQDGQFRKIDTVKIGDIEFLCVELPQSSTVNTGETANNFLPQDYSGSLIYLFPKI